MGNPGLGVLPSGVVCGRCSLYQAKKALSSLRKSGLRKGTKILRVHSSFMLLMKRSTTAMLPCLPAAPYRGQMPVRRHHRLKSSHQKILSLSQITYFGVAVARAIVFPRKVRTASEVGLLGKTVKPIARREKWSTTTATHQQNGQH